LDDKTPPRITENTMSMHQLLQAPLISPTQTVIGDWIDYNGHLNMAFYNVIFDRAVDHFYDLLGVGAKYTKSGAGSCFTMEVHVHYLNEVSLDDELELHLQLLDYDPKRLHYFQQMYHKEQGYLAATSEQLALHVDMTTRRAGEFPQHIIDKLDAMSEPHKALAVPAQVGHQIGIKRK
jgi:acyl-CoA thioester hydrolase